MMVIDPTAALGPVRLTVADLASVRSFYERALGLRTIADDGAVVALGAAANAPLVELAGRADAAPRPRGSCGLFHLALLYPARADLAAALRRLLTAGHSLDGASDHLVSEALYLSDPEGNGIELYRDRPRDEWSRDDRGELKMATLPLDVRALLDAAPGDADPAAPAATRMGHVHLNVSALGPAEVFYGGLLGFETTVRGYPGALFLAAGGYHHHIGLNTWASAGGSPNAPDRRGLGRFEIVLPGADALAPIAARLAEAGAPARQQDDGLLVTDPFGNDVLLRTRSAP